MRHFVVYDSPTLVDTFPRSGPAAQSFSLRLSGQSLSNGSDYVCRFAHGDGLLGANVSIDDASWGSPLNEPLPPPCCSQLSRSPCLGDEFACTAATFQHDDEIWCATPKVATPRLMSVQLTLNGQQYVTGSPSVLVPASGQLPDAIAAYGGSSVLVGSGFLPVQRSAPAGAFDAAMRICQKVPGTKRRQPGAASPTATMALAHSEIRIDASGNATS